MRLFSTLRTQFVLVVMAAVILSNFAVVMVFERFRDVEIRRVRLTAQLERFGNAFDLLSRLPSEQRESATRAMSGGFTHFSVMEHNPFLPRVGSRTAEEQQMIDSITSVEQNMLGEIHIRNISGNGDEKPPALTDRRRSGPAVEVTQAIDRDSWALVHFELPQTDPISYELWLGALFATIVTGGAAAWLAGRVSRPLSALTRAADEVARGRSVPLLVAGGPDDIRRASEAFNQMSDRVTRTLESQRQLLSAVGHDLRTPLAAMRITAEFVEDAEVRDRLTRNLDELQSLTEAVLSSLRSGQGEEMRRVDLTALIQSVCDDLVDLGQPVEVDIEESAPCLCRASEIRRAVRNLVENAIRYGHGAHVTLDRDNDWFTATIVDKGPGIPADRLEKVFEPFVRLEESRSSATGGSGLGLTLARTIAREHGGDVTLENRPGGGLCARLRLPRQPGKFQPERNQELVSAK